ncbi:uncharacterized protein LOC144180377 [Haemaphysalis longicornis]
MKRALAAARFSRITKRPLASGPQLDLFHRDSRLRKAFKRADELLGRTDDAFLADMMKTLTARDVDFVQRAKAAAASRYTAVTAATGMFRHTENQWSYREVGTLAHLFIQMRPKDSSYDVTEFARANQMRIVSVAQMLHIAQGLHDSTATSTAADDRVQRAEINTTNKIITLLGDMLFSLAFKTVAEMRDLGVLVTFSKSLENFSSSYFKEATGRPDVQQWAQCQSRATEPLAMAFECSLLLAGCGPVERAEARKCGTNLALAMQARSELYRLLKQDSMAVGPCSLAMILAQNCLSYAGDARVQQASSGTERQQSDAAGEVRRVIRELAGEVIGYVAGFEAGDASDAFRDIANCLRNT